MKAYWSFAGWSQGRELGRWTAEQNLCWIKAGTWLWDQQRHQRPALEHLCAATGEQSLDLQRPLSLGQ